MGAFDRFGPMAPGGNPNPDTVGRQVQTDEFAISGWAYVLTQTPDGWLFQLYLDGILQSKSNSTYDASIAGIIGLTDLSIYESVRFVYSYGG